MRSLEQIRKQGDDPAMIMSLDGLKLEMAQSDITINGMLEKLIRENKITANMATSLMNDATYATDVAKNLIQMGETLFAIGDYDLKEAERTIALTDTELKDILNDTQNGQVREQ